MNHSQAEGPRILIVEDDADLRQGLVIRLAASGYRVVAAPDAMAATAEYRKAVPDLIILDLGLPGGDGYEVINRWKAMGQKLPPIIVLSARDPRLSEAPAIRAGVRCFLQKPADNEQLLAEIKAALAGDPVPA